MAGAKKAEGGNQIFRGGERGKPKTECRTMKPENQGQIRLDQTESNQIKLESTGFAKRDQLVGYEMADFGYEMATT